MKKIIIFFLIVFIKTLTFADFCNEDWRYYKDINLPSKISQPYGTFSVDCEIYNGANTSLSDLRILDGSDIEIPCQLTIYSKQTKTTTYSARLMDLGYTDKSTSFVLDLGKSGIIHNALNLTTESKNFRRLVQVESSDDRVIWKTIRENATIFDVTTEYHTSHLQVTYPDSTSRYLRLNIDRKGKDRIEITGASVVRTKVIPASEEIREFQIIAKENNGKINYWDIDLGYEKVPVNHLKIEVSGMNFQRLVKILVPSNDKQSWFSVGEGTIWRFKTEQFLGESLTVEFDEIQTRRLRIEIHNFDNSPLKNVRLFLYGVKRELFLPVDRDKTYRLYYGNNEAQSPKYDLSAFVQYIDRSKIIKCLLGKQMSNPTFRPKDKRPWTEKYPVIFWTGLVFACLILGILIIRKGSEVLKTGK